MVGCDYLVHCGDLTNIGTIDEVKKGLVILAEQMKALKIKKAILVPGNHDNCLENEIGFKQAIDYTDELIRNFGVSILIVRDELIELDQGFKIFASPYYRRIGGGEIFSFHYSSKMTEKLFKELISPDIDILITHGPPSGILDFSESDEFNDKENYGCHNLLAFIQNPNSKIKHHIFGHIHQQGGKRVVENTVNFYNVACVAQVIEMEKLTNDSQD